MHYILIATEELPLSSHLTMSLAKYFHLGLTLELMSSSWLQVRKWGRVSATIQILFEKNHHLFPGILLSSRMFHRLSTPQTHHCKNKTDIRTPQKTAVTKTGTARNLLIICMCSPEFFSQSFSCHKITWTSTLNNIHFSNLPKCGPLWSSKNNWDSLQPCSVKVNLPFSSISTVFKVLDLACGV